MMIAEHFTQTQQNQRQYSLAQFIWLGKYAFWVYTYLLCTYVEQYPKTIDKLLYVAYYSENGV